MKRFNPLFICIVMLCASFHTHSQDCTAQIAYNLLNVKGGVYAYQLVQLTSFDGKFKQEKKTNESGSVSFEVPCQTMFKVTISNYTTVEEIKSGNEGSLARMTLKYEPNMKEKDASFAMDPTQKQTVDIFFKTLPDTTRLVTGIPKTPTNKDYYEFVTIKLKNLEQLPLASETIILTGEKRKKSFKGITDLKGEISLYVPKGDEYHVNFIHQKDYKKFNSEYRVGTSTSRMEITYMGTKEFLRRKKIEDERIAAEEKSLLEERLAFEKFCKERGVSIEEGFRLKLHEDLETDDLVIMKTLERNKWSEKLIVCDLTGSMDPYGKQLSVWYQLNYKKETNLQFVFFNDGDNKSDQVKKIGQTGGIYYQASKGLDSLIYLMSRVRSNGNGGDCPENNMEALIKGTKMAKPFKELVMIVDNDAPVKDIELLKSFNKPVHIILCGSKNGEVLVDYLTIAWKTKGSIHTIEEDITRIASMSEGEIIQIGGNKYQILGGLFVRITKT